MRKILFTFLFFLTFQVSIGQNIDTETFLLGIQGDYMGRTYPKNQPKYWGFIIQLHEDYSQKISKIEEIVGKKFKRLRKERDCSNCHEFLMLRSLKWEKRINRYYNFKDRSELNGYTGLWYKIHKGYLNCEKIIGLPKEKQLAFLAGCFLMHTTKGAGHCNIYYYNAKTKYDCVVKLLKIHGAEILETKISEGTIPTSYKIKFVPTDELREIIETIINE